jgi:hypothetical protein
MNATEERFDAALRACHGDALGRLSPATRAQLAQRRHAALRGERRHAPQGLRYAVAGFAAVSALVLGLQLRQPPLPTGSVPAQMMATTDAARPATILDEDPEFYAWLASSDARLVALE